MKTKTENSFYNGEIIDSKLNNEIGCVIMASGNSTRFGGNKLLEFFGDKPMIQHVIDAAVKVFAELIVVTRSEEIEKLCESQDVRVALHNYPGRNDTVRIGLEELGDDIKACFFCTADQPFISETSFRKIIAAVNEDGSRIYRASSKGTPGNPVCFPKWSFEELKHLPEKKGGGVVIKAHPECVSLIEVDPIELVDIDTKEDFEECSKLLG